MFLGQYYLGCLSQTSYLIGDERIGGREGLTLFGGGRVAEAVGREYISLGGLETGQ
jgi:hypothetical protein